MNTPFLYSLDNKRYHTYNYYLTSRFGEKVSRISLNGGFTCPNIDGTKGTGGCIYCSSAGSGEFAGNKNREISEQFEEISRKMGEKWDTPKHIAYFQANTNTYAPLEKLKRFYTQALACPGVVGLSIATRPDCLPEEVCDYLQELSQQTYVTVELGLQTIHNATGEKINRCHTYEEFLNGYEKLRRRNIPTGVHLINGLPGETPEMMVASAKAVGQLQPHLIKIHLLHVLEGTRLAQMYREGKVLLLSLSQYVQIVCDQLEWLPPETVLGRLTGDGDPKALLGPVWSLKKLVVLNEIDKELLRRDSWQGKKLSS